VHRRESESKFLVPSAEVLCDVPEFLRSVAGLHVRPGRTIRVRDVYVDTDDRWLTRAGVGLRLRRRAESTHWTLKADACPRTPEGWERIEIEQPTRQAPRFPCRLPPGPISTWLGPIARRWTLRPIGQLRIDRTEHEVSTTDGGCARVCCDSVGAQVAERSIDWAEVEWETVRDSKKLRRAMREFRRRTGWDPLTDSKIERAYRLAGISPIPAAPTKLNFCPTMQVADAIPALLNHFWHRVQWLWPRAYVGVDPEALHDLRVAFRRLRAVLWMFRTSLPDTARAFRNALRTIARAAGEVRDADVAMDLVQRFVESSKLESNESIALQEVIRPLRELRAERLRRFRAQWAGPIGHAVERTWARLHNQFSRFENPEPLKPFMRDVVRSVRRKAAKVIRKLVKTSPDADYHRARLAAKRYRYALELWAELDGRKVQRRLKRLREFQGLLGDLQDVVVLREWVRARSDRLRVSARRRVARRLLAWLEQRRRELRARAWRAVRRWR